MCYSRKSAVYGAAGLEQSHYMDSDSLESYSSLSAHITLNSLPAMQPCPTYKLPITRRTNQKAYSLRTSVALRAKPTHTWKFRQSIRRAPHQTSPDSHASASSHADAAPRTA